MWKTTEAQPEVPGCSQHQLLNVWVRPLGTLQESLCPSWYPHEAVHWVGTLPTFLTCSIMSKCNNCCFRPLSSLVVCYTAIENWNTPQNVFLCVCSGWGGGCSWWEIVYKKLILISINVMVVKLYVSSYRKTTKWIIFTYSVLNLRIWQSGSKEFPTYEG